MKTSLPGHGKSRLLQWLQMGEPPGRSGRVHRGPDAGRTERARAEQIIWVVDGPAEQEVDGVAGREAVELVNATAPGRIVRGVDPHGKANITDPGKVLCPV